MPAIVCEDCLCGVVADMVSQIMDLMDQRYVPEAAAHHYNPASAEQQLQITDLQEQQIQRLQDSNPVPG